MVDATAVRTKATTFDSSLRGFEKREVQSYLGRVALAVEALDASDSLSDLPPDLTPEGIRQRDFPITWLGYDRAQVDVYLAELADGIEVRRQ